MRKKSSPPRARCVYARKNVSSPEEEGRDGGKSVQPSSSSSLFFVRVDLEENINTSDDDEDEEDKFPFTGNKVKRLEGSLQLFREEDQEEDDQGVKTLALVIRRRLNRNWSSCRSFRPRSRWLIFGVRCPSENAK